MSIDKSDLKQAIEQYHLDGAAVLRNAIAPEWIERLGAAIEAHLQNSATAMDYGRPGEGRFFGDLFLRLRAPEIDTFIRDAGLPELAAQIMRSSEVRFFYDQLLVKEPGSTKRTPWHQDQPYWPTNGEQIISIWVPVDAASPENGVVTYVKGSHRWNLFHDMEAWSDHEPWPDVLRNRAAGDNPCAANANAPSIADIEDHPQNYQFLSWTVNPGDVLLHHPRTVHGAPGNSSSHRRRRALATRWLGDDARWADDRPHFMRLFRDQPQFPFPPLATGDRIDAPLFPKLWPRENS